MDEGFSNHSNIQWSGHTGVVEYGGGARGQFAMFYNRAVHNPAKSAETGRPVFEDKVYVRINPPGERLNIVDRPATQQDSKLWPMQWAQFQQNKKQTPEGTPIDLLYPEQPAMPAMLRANGVHTIEQCAELTAHAIETIGMGSQRAVNDAQKFLQMSSKGVKATQLRRELEERDGQIRVLSRQVEQLQGEVNRLMESRNGEVGLAQVQTMLAGIMGRPQHMPGKSFDAAAAQIAANHPTADIARQRKQPAKPQKAHRPRVKAI